MREDASENRYTLTRVQVILLFAVILVIAAAVVWAANWMISCVSREFPPSELR